VVEAAIVEVELTVLTRMEVGEVVVTAVVKEPSVFVLPLLRWVTVEIREEPSINVSTN